VAAIPFENLDVIRRDLGVDLTPDEVGLLGRPA